MIIGLTGEARSGKDTMADYLVSEYGFLKASFATALRMEVAEAFGVEVDLLEIDKDNYSPLMHIEKCTDMDFIHILDKHRHLSDNGMFSPRKILQLWGTELRRSQDSDYWVNPVRNRILSDSSQSWVVSDMRFANEHIALTDIGAISVKIINPRVKTVSKHSSEEFWKTCKADHEILNDGSKEEMYERIDRIIDLSYTVHQP